MSNSLKTTDISELLQPVTVAGLNLQSRFVMAPMTRKMSPDGIPTTDVAAYYRRRAQNRVGLIITEGTYIDHPTAGDEPDVPRLIRGKTEAGWRAVVEGVHEAGGKIFPQLWHLGGRRGTWDGVTPSTPSGVNAQGQPHGNALSLSDVDALIGAFAEAARLAYEIGFDGVELHGAHGYMIDEFLWAATNRRTDQYGGDFRNRARIAEEIIKAVRQATAPDFPICIRFSQWKSGNYEAKIAENAQELEALLTPMAEAGVNLFHASTRRYWEPAFDDGNDLNLAGWAKKITGLPMITVGSVGLNVAFRDGDSAGLSANIEPLLARLRNDEFDLVALGRVILANPDWITLVAEGREADLIAYHKDLEATLY